MSKYGTVSVIVTNAARRALPKNLKKCMESLMEQTYGDLQLISVFGAPIETSALDGGHDRRLETALSDGVGAEAARFAGMARAEGDWILFADSRDSFSADAVERMLEAAERTGADIVVGRTAKVIDRAGLIKVFDREVVMNNIVVRHDEFMNELYLTCFGRELLPHSLFGKLYRRSTIDAASPVRTGLTYGDHVCFDTQVMPAAKIITTVPDTVYFQTYRTVTPKIRRNLMDNAFGSYSFRRGYARKYSVKKAELTLAAELKDMLYTYAKLLYYFGGGEDSLDVLRRSMKRPELAEAAALLSGTKYMSHRTSELLELADAERYYEAVCRECRPDKLKFKLRYIILQLLRGL